MAGPELKPINTRRRQYVTLGAIGFAMGVADIIPGVSGGTIAFISGVYEQLLLAIASIDATFARRLLTGDIRGALKKIQFGFLLPLLTGIGLAIMLMSRVIHWLLLHHEPQVLALFMGLIAGSILMIGRKVPGWKAPVLACFGTGFVVAFILTGTVPVQTPDTLWFLFFCGMVAISAMILPGISGAFILLLLGKYHFMTGVLKNPFSLEHLLIIVVFMGGCVVGIAGFARVLKYGLARYYGSTMSLLTGFMAGALRKLWPWKERFFVPSAESGVVLEKTKNVLPEALDGAVFMCGVLFVAGFLLIMLVDRLGKKRQHLAGGRDIAR